MIYPPASATGRTPPARHAHTSHAPSGYAAGASRPTLGSTDTPVSLRLSFSQLLTFRLGPRLERGMYRGLCCAVGPAIPPPTPTPAHGTQAHCPPIGRFAASASGELHLSDSALCSARHGVACQIDWLDPAAWLTRQDRSWTWFVGSADLVLVPLAAPRSGPPPAHPRRATRAGPPPAPCGAGSFKLRNYLCFHILINNNSMVTQPLKFRTVSDSTPHTNPR